MHFVMQGETSKKINNIEVEYVNLLSELGVQWVPMMQIAESVTEKMNDSLASLDKPLISATTLFKSGCKRTGIGSPKISDYYTTCP